MESSRGDSDYQSNWHRNPDGPEAAIAIEGLLAINATLRGELEKVRHRLRLAEAVIRSQELEALSPMTVITGPEDLEPEDEGSIWDSSKNKPD